MKAVNLALNIWTWYEAYVFGQKKMKEKTNYQVQFYW